MSLTEFLYMGGYWPYVWPSYGLATIVLITIAVSAARQRKRLLMRIARRNRRLRRSDK